MNSNASLWIEEKDWLVEVVWINEDRTETINYAGRLLAFAFVTNTRVLAQIGDPDPKFPAYELWFSFTSEDNKKAFLDLVREDGYANPDEDDTLDPAKSLDELPQLQPLAAVFPEDAMRHILAAQLITLTAMQSTAEGTVN